MKYDPFLPRQEYVVQTVKAPTRAHVERMMQGVVIDGVLATPLEKYTVEDIRREFLTEKSCAPRCTVACVHYTSRMDFWRAPQTIAAPPAARGCGTSDSAGTRCGPHPHRGPDDS